MKFGNDMDIGVNDKSFLVYPNEWMKWVHFKVGGLVRQITVPNYRYVL